MSVLDKITLNAVQRDAVTYDGGPQLVFAGAGTGKTRVLTAKIAWLIEQGLYPSQILAATFTNKAAREMRDRVESLTGLPAAGMWIGTFHSMCARILRRDGHHLGYQASFSIYDTGDQLSLMKKVLKTLEIDDRSIPPRQALSIISNYKNACITLEKVEAAARGFFEQEIVRIYKAYQKALFDSQAMDFDDLLSNTVYLFQKSPETLDRYRTMFQFILVDEYQDTNAAQFLFLKLLSAGRERVFVVGDDDQSIYGWRGAKVENILSFEKEFPGTKVFMLEQNYRSTKVILDFANAAISENTTRAPKKLWTSFTGGQPVTVTRFRDDRQEADSVAERIGELLSQKVKGGAMAILYRTNAQSRVFEDVLRRQKVPYILVGGMSFYERAEVKDCLAYLRLLVNPKDNVSFERIFNLPARGLGDKASEALTELAASQGKGMLETVLTADLSALSPRYQKGFSEVQEIFSLLIDLEQQKKSLHEIFEEMLKLSGYMDMLTSDDSEESADRIENINELDHAISSWSEDKPEGTLTEFLEEVSLASDVDKYNQKEDCVTLMTLHAAKGLEFKCVFLVGLEDGILPSRQNFDDQQKIEEERRLLYVGITRAMERLDCSHVDSRWRFGDMVPGFPSRFLQSIPAELYHFRDRSHSFGSATSSAPHKFSGQKTFRTTAAPVARPAVRYMPKDEFSQDTVEYRMGQVVRHKIYGQGRIVQVSGFGDDMKLSVVFNDGNRKKLMAKFANFEE
ncbi:MAG: UvrD-helicase domain-containing protein [Chitinispirillaceae bacterium]|jgi:DNA helicase-2/ATP-dependent DNA helicase PcrA|nr:UvrD-helicase domain-containing protein [Chitinispirillaceae bacterium]